MLVNTPSRTAWAAAGHRAVHQVVEHGAIFSDPLALPILGKFADKILQDAKSNPGKEGMRIFVAARSRFAEDALAAAFADGARQLVVLGAGLDTFAYRSPYGERLRIFEVDHPATQEWKRRRLRYAQIPIPRNLTFATVDFESQNLVQQLMSAGFDSRRQTFFSWLGVVPYLTQGAVWATLGFIAGLPKRARVVFDYGDPPDTRSPKARAHHGVGAHYVKAQGEAWLSYFRADTLRAKLLALGFSEIEDLGPREIATRYFSRRVSSIPDKGGHLLCAATPL
jgi:methyltransferase (TIGR00027 family)